MKRKTGAGAGPGAKHAKAVKAKPVRPPPPAQQPAEEEVEVGEEDLAFFDEHAGFAAGFLDR